ncbi:zinc ribbon domain-containing protein [uncultured Methanobrevibacter sp.]|uniref:zinc ribbon domain-containing protein n=1 Tax=uncultured Methanobrevibacter sp. TaxID=253161 RepID=UPI00261FA2EF|nr:zinc ribbon domain-containing protein [uncultured Methanobrevibacter sp.]
MVKCNKCGALIDENDKFCMNCGNKLNFKILDIPQLVTLEKCPVCKKGIVNEWNYCRYCGYNTINPNQGTSMLKKNC